MKYVLLHKDDNGPSCLCEKLMGGSNVACSNHQSPSGGHCLATLAVHSILEFDILSDSS